MQYKQNILLNVEAISQQLLCHLYYCNVVSLCRSDIKRRPRECSFFNGTSDVLKPDRDISKFNSSQMVYFNITRHVKVRNVTRCSSSTDEFEKLYLPGVRRGASKGHGIIRINLSQVCSDHTCYLLIAGCVELLSIMSL